MLGFLWRVIKWTIIVAVFVFLINFWLGTKSYVFSQDAVAKIAKKHMSGTDAEQMFKKIHKEFQKQYPGHILPAQDLQWIFVNAGGWMGSMCLLHASLTEYVLFFGTAVDTVGHSGRYWANITDTLLTGSMKQWQEGTLKAKIYKPGDMFVHTWGDASAIKMAADTWTVQYCRGFIPSMMPFVLGDTLTSSQDFMTVFYTLRIYAKALLLEANVYVGQARDYIAQQLQ